MPRSWSRVAGVLLVCLFTAVAWRPAASALSRPPADRQADLHVYLGAIETVRNGRPLYDYAAENGDPFTYPPFALIVLQPLGWAPEPAVRVAWTLCTLVIAGLIAAALTRRRVLVMAAALVLVLSAPLQSNLRFGQISVLLVLLVLVDGLGLTRPRWRGALIGLAAAIKLTPLLFLPYLVLTGQRRAATRATGVFVVAAGLAFVALPEDSARFWTDAVFTTSRVGDLSAGGNQSVNGALLRLGVLEPVKSAAWLLYAGGLAWAALLWGRRLYADGRVAEAVVTVGCATLVVSPVSWTHHQVWLVLAGLVLLAGPGRARRAAGVAVLLVMIFPLAAEARLLCAAALCCAGLPMEIRAATGAWAARDGRPLESARIP
ncbi:hypothetical protein GCM10010411_84390 [Actinomadura fulvescens]|uniref:DUF2029 domain-containing protein n=2 Tax=Actinomadura fulvescens TaxID=46160 RepID=A0ABP6D164_9ACTN